MTIHTLVGSRKQVPIVVPRNKTQHFKAGIKDRNASGWDMYIDGDVRVCCGKMITFRVPKELFPQSDPITLTGTNGTVVPTNYCYREERINMAHKYNLASISVIVRISDEEVQVIGDRQTIDLKFSDRCKCETFMKYMEIIGDFPKVNDSKIIAEMGKKMFRIAARAREALEKPKLEFVGNFNKFRMLRTRTCTPPVYVKDLPNQLEMSLEHNASDIHIIMQMIKKIRFDMQFNVLQIRQEMNDYTTTDLDYLIAHYDRMLPDDDRGAARTKMERLLQSNKQKAMLRLKISHNKRIIHNLSSTGPKSCFAPKLKSAESKKRKRSFFNCC